jgi:Zn-dependent protease
LPVFAAAVQYGSPLFWAVVIGWIMSVVLHELGHGIVGYLGGDYTIKERGGLTLNPLQYIDPVMSIALPALFVIMGGVPLPGASTFIRRDLLRSRGWETAMSLAGPAVNLLLFFLLCLLMNPALGLVDWSKPAESWTTLQLFLGATAVLQAFSVVLNLIPWPPVDGFNAIAPYLPVEWQQKVMTPPLNFILMIMFFLVISRLPQVGMAMGRLVATGTQLAGLPPGSGSEMVRAFQLALWGT